MLRESRERPVPVSVAQTSIQGEVVRIHPGVWHKFQERWRKGTLPMTEEGRPLCLSDSPKTATLMRRMVNRLGKSPRKKRKKQEPGRNIIKFSA